MKSLVLWLGFTLLAGCASNPVGSPDSAAYATCRVCEHNNDLGCVRFRKRETTPTLSYQGETLYFCGEDCRAACAKNPAKYVTTKSR
jgi:YHS domain-containing protein